MMDDWKCPNCGAHNKVDLGDLNDQTSPDVEAVTCYACGVTDWLCPESQDYAETLGETLDDAFAEDGQIPCLRCKGSGLEPRK